VFYLVTALRDGVADAPAAQLASGRGVAVCLVAQQVRRPVPGLVERVEQEHQAGVVAGLAGREQHGDGMDAAVDQGMDLGG
jgi:hypothetical protein